jgi:hypothetical protein
MGGAGRDRDWGTSGHCLALLAATPSPDKANPKAAPAAQLPSWTAPRLHSYTATELHGYTAKKKHAPAKGGIEGVCRGPRHVPQKGDSQSI